MASPEPGSAGPDRSASSPDGLNISGGPEGVSVLSNAGHSPSGQRPHGKLPSGFSPQVQEGAKQTFFCDLARTARENCELAKRTPEGQELCLKMAGYYTNSRHCGYRP